MVEISFATLGIVLLPSLIVLLYYFFVKRGNNRKLFFLLGFLSITLFYIFAPDPAVIQSLYIQKGDFIPPLTFSLIASAFLILALFYFRRTGL